MSPLADKLLEILNSEADYPPLSVEKLAEVLRVTGYGTVTAGEIEAALGELLASGQMERLWRRGAAHYRAVRPGAPIAHGA